MCVCVCVCVCVCMHVFVPMWSICGLKFVFESCENTHEHCHFDQVCGLNKAGMCGTSVKKIHEPFFQLFSNAVLEGRQNWVSPEELSFEAKNDNNVLLMLHNTSQLKNLTSSMFAGQLKSSLGVL